LNNLWDIVGHDKVLSTLESDIDSKNLSHAYLFFGPDRIGKFSVAKRFSTILQCKNSGCGECSVCKEIFNGYHADTIEMVDNDESVKIEEIREVLRRLNITHESPYKIFLLQNIERLTLPAANSLLKTLEDPPNGVIFLLTTNSLKDVLPTILSRVRSFAFNRLTDETLEKMLVEKFPQSEARIVKSVIDLVGGSPGKAIAFFENQDTYKQYLEMYEKIEKLLKTPDIIEQFSHIEKLVAASKEDDNRKVIFDFFYLLETILRKELLLAAQLKRGIFSVEKLLRLLEQVSSSIRLLKGNINARLLLENMMLSL